MAYHKSKITYLLNIATVTSRNIYQTVATNK